MKNDLQEIYTNYAPTLFKVCLRYSSSYAEAEDLLHDSFLRIYERLSQFKGKGSFEGWMKRIVVSVALNKLRTNRYTPDYHEAFDGINESEIEVDKDDLPEERKLLLEAGLTHEDVLNCLQHLPAKARAVFNLYVFENKKHREIARELEITASTSKTQLKRARVLLHKQLTKHAEMKLRHIKKLSILAFLLPGRQYVHVDKFVKESVEKANISAPPMDFSSIAGTTAAGTSAIPGSVSLLGQIMAHLKSHLITYTAVVVVGGAAITLFSIPEAKVNKESSMESINLRMHPALMPFDLDSFMQAPLNSYDDKPIKVELPVQTSTSVDTITIYEHVRVIDSLK